MRIFLSHYTHTCFCSAEFSTEFIDGHCLKENNGWVCFFQDVNRLKKSKYLNWHKLTKSSSKKGWNFAKQQTTTKKLIYSANSRSKMFYTFLTWQIGEVSFTFISEGFWFHKIRNMFSSLANFSNASLEINTFLSQKISAAFRAGWNFFLIINNFDFFLFSFFCDFCHLSLLKSQSASAVLLCYI